MNWCAICGRQVPAEVCYCAECERHMLELEHLAAPARPKPTAEEWAQHERENAEGLAKCEERFDNKANFGVEPKHVPGTDVELTERAWIEGVDP